MDSPVTSEVTMNHIYGKSSTSNTNIVDLVHNAEHYPADTLGSPLILLKALEMLFVSCVAALCPQQTGIDHLNSSR